MTRQSTMLGGSLLTFALTVFMWYSAPGALKASDCTQWGENAGLYCAEVWPYMCYHCVQVLCEQAAGGVLSCFQDCVEAGDMMCH